MGLVNTADKESRLSHINSLVAVASADGDFDSAERKLIGSIASRLGLSKSDLDEMDQKDEIAFHIPETQEDKLELVYDLVQVMMADGLMDDSELKICKHYTTKLGFDDVSIALLLASAISNVKQERDQATAMVSMAAVIS